MSETHAAAPDRVWRVPRADARATIKLLRAQIQAYAQVPKLAADGSPVERRAIEHVVPGDLPECLLRLLQMYRDRHPDLDVEPVSYLEFGLPDDKTTPLAMQDLPDEENLAVLTCTESAADFTEVYVRTQTLVVRHRRKG
jgi:hypothetical protein